MPKKFKVAIDVSPLNDGNSVRGVGYYTQHLLTALQSEIKTNPDYQDIEINLIQDSRSDTSNFDLIHYPYFDPFFLTLPAKKNIPQIITIHDLIPIQFKSHFPSGIRGYLKWLIQSYRARQSEYIITVSHYSKNIISQLLRFPLSKIYVTYEAAEKSYHPNYSTKEKAAVIKKYNLPKEFILNNGDINWNKNIPSLVRSCLKLNYPLVLVGGASTKKVEPHPWNEDIIWIQSQTSPLIHRLGYVPDADLPIIYSLAKIYCQPSYAEGFGLSLVKAMLAGTPIVYSSETSLPEVMGEAGVSFDPYDHKALTLALKKLWSDKALLRQQSTLGLVRAKFFSWKLTAKQTLAVYDLVKNR